MLRINAQRWAPLDAGASGVNFRSDALKKTTNKHTNKHVKSLRQANSDANVRVTGVVFLPDSLQVNHRCIYSLHTRQAPVGHCPRCSLAM